MFALLTLVNLMVASKFQKCKFLGSIPFIFSQHGKLVVSWCVVYYDNQDCSI